MGVRHDIHDNLLNNPIAWREFVTLFRQRGKWFWRILYGLTTLLIITPLFFGWSRHYDDAVGFIAAALIFANVIIYPLVIVRSIMTTNESVARERRSRTWDLLMLTGVSTWRVVFGKWLGAMRFATRDYVWLYVLRVSAFLWFIAADSSLNDSIPETLQLLDIQAHSSTFWTALGFSFMLAFTIAEMLFSTALGIATAFFNWRTRTGSGVAIGIRIALAIALFFGTIYFAGYMKSYSDRPQYDDHVDEFIWTFATTFVDNGVINSGRMASDDWLDARELRAIRTALTLNLLFYLVLTGIALEVARTVAHRVGVNNPGAPMLKSKKKNSVHEPMTIRPSQRTIAIPPGAANIFELAEPADYRTEVYHYQRRLGRMYLRLSNNNEPLYVQLSNVNYIEAPSVWTGAAFRTATQSEYEIFVQEKGLTISHLTDKSMRLYVVDGASPVRIVAGTMQMMDELPMDV